MAKSSDLPVQISLRPYASSLPLASFAFGVGNALYSAYILQWIPATEARSVALALLAFVAPLELVPSLMAFLARDAGGATAFGVFGAAWVVQGLAMLGGPPPAISHTAGVFLLCLVVCLLILAVVTFKGKPLLAAVLCVAVVRSGSAAASAFTGAAWLQTCTAYSGLLLTVLAFYCGAAFLEEDVTGRLSSLTFRTGAARAAMEGRLEEQTEALEREAGVRKQL